MDEEFGLFTVYQLRGDAQRKGERGGSVSRQSESPLTEGTMGLTEAGATRIELQLQMRKVESRLRR